MQYVIALEVKLMEENNVSLAVALKQQSKNLRSNLSILNQLERKFDIQSKNVYAMVFLGTCL